MLKLPAIISSIIVIPFIGMELYNRHGYYGPFPVILFAVLWAISFLFFLVLIPAIKTFRHFDKFKASLVASLLRITALIVLGFFWVGIVLDQMPCFLGYPNCD